MAPKKTHGVFSPKTYMSSVQAIYLTTDIEVEGQTRDTSSGQSLQGGPCQAGKEPWPRDGP